MKKTIFLLMFLFASIICFGQRYGHSIDISAGITQDGFAISGGYNYYLSETSFLSGSGATSFSSQEGNVATVNYDVYAARFQYFKEVYSTRRAGFTIYIGGGVVTGYENVSVSTDIDSRGFSSTKDSGFILGPILTADLDIFLSRKSSITVTLNEQWQITSDVGQFIPYAGIGYRYTLN